MAQKQTSRNIKGPLFVVGCGLFFFSSLRESIIVVHRAFGMSVVRIRLHSNLVHRKIWLSVCSVTSQDMFYPVIFINAGRCLYLRMILVEVSFNEKYDVMHVLLGDAGP